MLTEERSKLAGLSDASSTGTQRLFPATSSELVTALSHYYRGEMARMMSWRDRIDRTSNWAITVVAGMLSLALSTPTAHHSLLIFGMLVVVLLLLIEARRYRFFDVYRNRVRLIERNYYAQIFSPLPIETTDQTEWLLRIGEDLRRPQFLLPLDLAIARRLRRNYSWMFSILLLAWLFKTTTEVKLLWDGQVEFIQAVSEFSQNAAIGILPGWVILIFLAALYGGMIYLMLTRRQMTSELAIGEVHV